MLTSRAKFSILVFAMTLQVLLLSSCLTHKRGKEMEDDIYRLQTRILQLESNVTTTRANDQKIGEAQHKTIASTTSDLERLNIDVKRMKGDIDALKIGVQTGQLPGQEAVPEGSIAAQLAEIRSRLDAIEQRQHELSAERGPASKKDKKSDAPSGNSTHADSDSIKAAFDRKNYKEVVEDAPVVLKKVKGAEKSSILMLYGDSLMKLGRPKEAALQYNEIVELNPSDKIMAQSKLKLGDAFKALGDKDTSKLFYEEVASKFAGTPEGDKAKKALKKK